MSFIKYVTFLILVSVTASCHYEYDEIYLSEHPQALKKAVERCRETSDGNLSPYCTRVMHVASNLVSLINEQQEDPENFGQKIMEKEAQYVQLKQAVEKAHTALIAATSQMPSKDLQVLQVDYDKQKENFKNAQAEMQTLLAVAGMRSPE